MSEKEKGKSRKCTLLELVQNLKPGDRIEIHWIDASGTKNVKNIVLPLPPGLVETRRKAIGWFIGLQKGDTWRDIHLIFETDVIDPDSPTPKHEISSIPFAHKCQHCGEMTSMLVKRVLPLQEGKEAKKFKRGQTEEPKNSRRYRKSRQRFPDGSVKFLNRMETY